MSEETKYLVAKATPVDETAYKNVGSWKSGLFDCFKYGVCHNALLCACCTPTILLAQLLTRMKMTWKGKPTSASEEYKKTFCNVITVASINFAINSVFYCIAVIPYQDSDGDLIMVQNEECVPWQMNLVNWSSRLFMVYTFIVMVRLRRTIRAKYSIPETNCEGCEDYCCVFFCGFCSAVQMAHQTAEYENQDALCFTTTGLSPSEDPFETLTEATIV